MGNIFSPKWTLYASAAVLFAGLLYETGTLFPEGIIMVLLFISIAVQKYKYRDNKPHKYLGMDHRLAYGIQMVMVGLCSFWAYFDCKLITFVGVGTFCVIVGCFWIWLTIVVIRHGDKK